MRAPPTSRSPPSEFVVLPATPRPFSVTEKKKRQQTQTRNGRKVGYEAARTPKVLGEKVGVERRSTAQHTVCCPCPSTPESPTRTTSKQREGARPVVFHVACRAGTAGNAIESSHTLPQVTTNAARWQGSTLREHTPHHVCHCHVMSSPSVHYHAMLRFHKPVPTIPKVLLFVVGKAERKKAGGRKGRQMPKQGTKEKWGWEKEDGRNRR